MTNQNQTTRMCDCELSHNGLGMMIRECDCDERKAAAMADREAEALAWNDARLFGTGFLMITREGKKWLPTEAVSIDRRKLKVNQNG